MIPRKSISSASLILILSTAFLVFFTVFTLRNTGNLQLFDFMIYDRVLRSIQPQNATDSRIVIVEIDERDINNEEYGGWPLSDTVLANLLQAIKRLNPAVIGVDIIRDVPVPASGEELAELESVLDSSNNIIAVHSVSGPNNIKLPPPKILAGKPEQLGFIDIHPDRYIGNQVRRMPLFLDDGETLYHSFGLRLSLAYLKSQNIVMAPSKENPDWLALGDTDIPPFEMNDGAYRREDARGYQILLDFKGPSSFETVSMTDVFAGNVPAEIAKGKIVILGVTAPSVQDFHDTPVKVYQRGVVLHAQLVNQLLRFADGTDRPLKICSEWQELLWVFMWCLIGCTMGYFLRSTAIYAGLLPVCVMVPVLTCYLALRAGTWMPVSGSVFGCVFSALIFKFIRFHIELRKTNCELAEANRTLESKVVERTRQLQEINIALEDTLTTLKMTQNQLITQEKLASLGTLTAGIAHEIKNPLNFINNFAAMSVETIKELNSELHGLKSKMADEGLSDLEEIIDDLRVQSEKINEHGRRADKVVNGMLSHSRNTSVEKESVDINKLLEQYITLIDNTMRTDDPEFEIEIERKFDASIEKMEVFPQELGRVFLNILTNACYAADEKKRCSDSCFAPKLCVTSRNFNDKIIITIKDNGNGIPEEIHEKIFMPFFTTKPTGYGTGLGMSLSYEIITQQHRGTLRFDTKTGEYTQFIITLPKAT